jgi:hypothetical protein
MKYTPFLASYIFFFIYFNAKLFLIFFDSDIATNEKIKLLSYDEVCYWKPMAGALFYTLVFPFAQIGFYSAKVWFDKKMNERKQKIEKQTLLSVEESRDIRYASYKMQEELDTYIKKYEQNKKEYDEYKERLEKEYQEKEKVLDEAESRLTVELKEKEDKITRLETELSKLQSQKNEKQKFHSKKPALSYSDVGSFDNSGGVNSLVSKAKEKSDKEYESLVSSLTEDEKKILKTFYENDSQMNKDRFKEKVLKDKNMQKVTSEKAIRSLVKKEMVTDKHGTVGLTELGLGVVDEIFRK